MITIIPCAGRGTRRHPDTNYLPKILLQYEGKPLIEHIARPIDDSGRFEKIVFVLSPRTGQQIVDYLRRNPLKTGIKFVWQGEPLGFGHAVLQVRAEVFSWRRRQTPVLIHTDDSVNRHCVEGKSLIKAMTDKKISQVGVQWRGNLRDYGLAIASYPEGRLPRNHSHSPGRVERLVEKPYWDEGGLCMTGIYFVRESRRLFQCLNKLLKTGGKLGGEYQLTHALQMMIDAGTPFQTYYHKWIDCGGKKKSAYRRQSAVD